MGGRSHCNCPGLNNLHTKIPLKIYAILYKTNTYIFALRKTTTTQLIVNNIFISILFDFRMQFVQPGTPRTSDIESRISYLESRISCWAFVNYRLHFWNLQTYLIEIFPPSLGTFVFSIAYKTKHAHLKKNPED